MSEGRQTSAEGRARVYKRLEKDMQRQRMGIVYFIRCANHVKIGFTIDLPKRFKSIQTFAPHKPELILSVLGKPDLEKEFHDMFAHLRTHGEWFWLFGDLRHFLKNMCKCDV